MYKYIVAENARSKEASVQESFQNFLGIYLQTKFNEVVVGIARLLYGASNSFAAKLPVARVDCSAKKYCKDMSICDEAKAHLTQCGMKNLDRDGDGVPCEALCD